MNSKASKKMRILFNLSQLIKTKKVRNLMQLKLIKKIFQAFKLKKQNSYNGIILMILAQDGIMNNKLIKILVKSLRKIRMKSKILFLINNKKLRNQNLKNKKVSKLIISHQGFKVIKNQGKEIKTKSQKRKILFLLKNNLFSKLKILQKKKEIYKIRPKLKDLIEKHYKNSSLIM